MPTSQKSLHLDRQKSLCSGTDHHPRALMVMINSSFNCGVVVFLVN
ncbi:hypothetical protein YPPY66_1905 [Yersinia pestis PY-66]|uniref:Uncharacterized protein n=2 Tax=Yersinia pseudotuberculosis complex TaxID=1649845 RepID=A0A0U1QZ22_YERP3|nr:hypothetical protein YpsIP31758_2528 [Yersinia pseudotuberculosis IP 31758]EDR30595.1 hypothetical protein YPIP275_0805 [Yersinia pestis biovar Orientalis str. IP275]EDR40836.1 hypothetical protein YpF1991016_0220 [Yersinia pestis biovar Orientalis str. F1991016]EDR51519.1 hypothetical protein YpB42003004_2483 [Yersinia pestis biovar Antiqua str. B42003004]EDR58416.1 hypothetical protein YpMG051020_0464 [Yersinia pestis biovar Orientalis str. MG05-1020]EDR59692.1 hypothetical protein YpUG05